jgi:putative hemolysin
LLTSVLLLAALGAPAGDTSAPAPAIAPTLAAAVGLLCCSAFFSASETTLFSLQPVDRQSLPDGARQRVDALLAQPRQVLATILIGNETVNVTLSSVVAGLLFAFAPDRPWLNILVVTPVLLIFGEIVPKVLALRVNRRAAPVVAVPLRLVMFLVTPLRWVLTRLAELFLRISGGSTAPQEAELREAQLRALIDQGTRSGSIKPMEQEIIHKVFDFGDYNVSRLMTPRPDIFSINLTTPWPELIERVRHQGFSRIPVYQGAPDNIIGVLVAKKLLPFIQRVQAEPGYVPSPREVQRLLLPARFVPPTKLAAELLQDFRQDRFHMAIVVDEHGSLSGLVTLDDLLAQLVGEILDETDTAADPEVTALGQDQFTVRGSMDVADFNERFGVELPEGDYTTVAGFVMDEAGELPAKGAVLEAAGFRWAVVGVEGRRITELCVVPIGVPERAPAELAREDAP